MAGCSFGSSRKYQNQTKTQVRLTTPMMMKAARQLSSTISQATSGGVTALPKRAKECVSPWAKPRRPAGVQYCMARVAVGNVAPSPKPSRTRHRKSETMPLANPVRMVATAQMRPQANNVRRGPKRSPTQPPMIWKIA